MHQHTHPGHIISMPVFHLEVVAVQALAVAKASRQDVLVHEALDLGVVVAVAIEIAAKAKNLCS